MLLLIGRQSFTGIGYADLYHLRFIHKGVGFHEICVYGDITIFLCEFNGIAEQVGDDLSEPVFIAPYQRQIGFISSVAEFTPKTVETNQLRTSLVYRLRVIVKNPDNGLRQGMPVTVIMHTNDKS